MSSQRKPNLSSKDASEIISQITQSDSDRARLFIGAGVQAAQAQWIEAPLIAEALARELVAVAQHNHTRAHIAGYLRELAALMDAESDCH